MKKQTLIRSLLILLPVLAVGLATTTDSVTVFDTVTGTTEYYSYFDPASAANLQMLLPLAATMCLVSGILAAVYLGKKSMRCLKISGYVAFAAAAVASIPIMLRGEVLVIPNMGVPVFMLLHYGVAYFVAKMPQETKNSKHAPRLKKR